MLGQNERRSSSARFLWINLNKKKGKEDMKRSLIFLLLCFSTAHGTTVIPLVPYPVFLKMGFSSVLEFDGAPTRVVLGDAQSFQVERLDKAIVVRALVPYATGNMFVYFGANDPKLFTLTASEDANPTYYRKFESSVLSQIQTSSLISHSDYQYKRSTRLLTASFNGQKDYLTVEIEITADSKEVIKPRWDWVRLTYNKIVISPTKLWAARKEVQKDSRVKARFVFTKPNVPRTLAGVSLVVPVFGYASPISLALKRGKE